VAKLRTQSLELYVNVYVCVCACISLSVCHPLSLEAPVVVERTYCFKFCFIDVLI